MTWVEFVQTLKTGWLIVVLGCVAGLALGLGAAQIAPVKYDASATCLVTVKTSGSVTELQLADQFAQSRARSYAAVASSSRVLSAVARTAGLAPQTYLDGSVTTSISPDTSIINIVVTDTDAARAAAIANAIEAETAKLVRSLDGGRRQAVNIVMLSPAVAPTRPTQPQILIYAGCGLVTGAVAGFVGAAFRGARQHRRARERVSQQVASPPHLASARR